MCEVPLLLEAVSAWAGARDDVLAVLLVGSYARGSARPDSDVDLVMLCADPHVYLADMAWPAQFGAVTRAQDEDWGMVQSRRVFYAGGPQVEFGLTVTAWAAVNPVDPGTQQVVTDGARILYDPHGLLAALIAAVGGRSTDIRT